MSLNRGLRLDGCFILVLRPAILCPRVGIERNTNPCLNHPVNAFAIVLMAVKVAAQRKTQCTLTAISAIAIYSSGWFE